MTGQAGEEDNPRVSGPLSPGLIPPYFTEGGKDTDMSDPNVVMEAAATTAAGGIVTSASVLSGATDPIF